MLRSAALLLAVASAHAYEWYTNGNHHTGSLRTTANPTICDNSVKQYAGWYDIDNNSKHYFYWAFEARQPSANTPTILWMTGGPGCSSQMALLFENGPCKVNPDGRTTTLNPYSWNQNANIIYIDQPAGVGFSYGVENDRNETGIANDMFAFLQDLVKEHPTWAQNFFIFGESYGGHYAPATAHRVWLAASRGEGIKISLTGLGVGNGLTDPEIQYQYYAQDAYNFSISYQGHPAVSLTDYQAMTAAIPECVAQIQKCNQVHGGIACFYAQQLCNQAMIGPYSATGLNPYDMRRPCGDSPLCYNFTAIDTFLNSKATQAELGVNATWKSCNNQVNFEFSMDWMQNYQGTIPDLLNNNVRVLIYAGEVDFICNWIGNKAWSLALPWPGKNAFNAATDNDWMVQGEKAGFVRNSQGFTFLQIKDAGHMVPHDQPLAAQTMLTTFLTGGKW